MQVQPSIIAASRRLKAADCQRGAENHGLNTVHGANYAREARYWRAAADMAERGDTRPRPAIFQTEEREEGRVWALVYRPHPHTGVAECVAVETFSDVNLADAWGRLHADELNAQAPTFKSITAA